MSDERDDAREDFAARLTPSGDQARSLRPSADRAGRVEPSADRADRVEPSADRVSRGPRRRPARRVRITVELRPRRVGARGVRRRGRGKGR